MKTTWWDNRNLQNNDIPRENIPPPQAPFFPSGRGTMESRGPFLRTGSSEKNGGALCGIEPYCLPSGCFNQQAIVWLLKSKWLKCGLRNDALSAQHTEQRDRLREKERRGDNKRKEERREKKQKEKRRGGDEMKEKRLKNEERSKLWNVTKSKKSMRG